MRTLLLFLLLLSVGQATAQDTLPAHGPRIAFDHVVHQFGELPQGGDGRCTFTFTNTGDEPLVITSCMSSCGCVVPSYDRDPVPPRAAPGACMCATTPCAWGPSPSP